MIDADIAKRHHLSSIQVINEYAKMTLGDERILGKRQRMHEKRLSHGFVTKDYSKRRRGQSKCLYSGTHWWDH